MNPSTPAILFALLSKSRFSPSPVFCVFPLKVTACTPFSEIPFRRCYNYCDVDIGKMSDITRLFSATVKAVKLRLKAQGVELPIDKTILKHKSKSEFSMQAKTLVGKIY